MKNVTQNDINVHNCTNDMFAVKLKWTKFITKLLY